MIDVQNRAMMQTSPSGAELAEAEVFLGLQGDLADGGIAGAMVAQYHLAEFLVPEHGCARVLVGHRPAYRESGRCCHKSRESGDEDQSEIIAPSLSL